LFLSSQIKQNVFYLKTICIFVLKYLLKPKLYRMKYLKYLLGIIALLALLFIGKGILTPSISYSSEIIVDKPVEEAWMVMNDESKINQWIKGITNMEHVSGVKGTVGAVTKYTFVEDGQESIMLETLKTVRPNEQAAMDFVVEGAMAMDYQVNFSEIDGKTHIQSSTTTTGAGLIMRSIVSFMKSTMQASEDENMANLKKLIEENTTNYFPVFKTCFVSCRKTRNPQLATRIIYFETPESIDIIVRGQRASHEQAQAPNDHG